MVDIGSQILAGIEASRRDMDADLDYKVKKVTEKFSESLHIVANEPSLALYRLQEHVRKTLPVLSEKRNEMKGLQQEIQGMCYDAEYASHAVKRMQGSGQYFSSIDEQIKKAIYLKQELNKNRSTKPSSTPIATPHQPSSSSASNSPAHKVSASNSPAHKVSASNSPAHKVSASSSPAHKVSASNSPAHKVSASNSPAHKGSTSNSPAHKVSASSSPAHKAPSSHNTPEHTATTQPKSDGDESSDRTGKAV